VAGALAPDGHVLADAGVVAGDFQYSFANITSVLLAQSTGRPLAPVVPSARFV